MGVEECFAANNMDHVLRGVAGTLAADLGMGDALSGIEERHGGLVADACRKTARTLVRNAKESVEHQVSSISVEHPWWGNLDIPPLLRFYPNNPIKDLDNKRCLDDFPQKAIFRQNGK